MALEHDTTLATETQALVLAQYLDLPVFMSLVGQLAAQSQPIEDALWDLSQAMLLDTAEDIWLDYLGAIVGEAREGYSDEDYRSFIFARILANRSSGSIDELEEILALMLGTDVDVSFESVTEYFPCSILIVILSTVHPDTALRSRFCRMLARARAAGVRLLINSNSTDDNSFTCGDSDNSQPETDAMLGFGDSGDPDTGGKFASGDLA